MKRVLVIDDDEQLRALVCEILERAGYQVQEAANGKAGIALFRAQPADLIITDLIMPEGEGIETIMHLRRDFPALPVVAISGGGRNGPRDYLSLAQQLGARKTLCKPFSRDELLDTVRAALAAN